MGEVQKTMAGRSRYEPQAVSARRFYRQLVRQQIALGSEWFKEIQSALTNSKVAVLLVSPDFGALLYIRGKTFTGVIPRTPEVRKDGSLARGRPLIFSRRKNANRRHAIWHARPYANQSSSRLEKDKQLRSLANNRA